MDWSPQQERALASVQSWVTRVHADEDVPKVFRLFGFAGTGKSTLAKHIGDMENERARGYTQYAAFTGKAAVVMRRKGCDNARTLHGMIYTSHDKSQNELTRLNEELEAAKARNDGRRTYELSKAIDDEKQNLLQPGFSPKPRVSALTIYADEDEDERDYGVRRPIATVSLLVIDECSMVDERLGKDVLNLGVPILVLGDPAQLPPVAAGAGYFTAAKPDILLTEIHRQAADSPIIAMASRVRLGQSLDYGDYGQGCGVVENVAPQEWLDADQILCWKNVTRKAINARVRTLKGHEGFLPNPGEKLVCLRNSREEGLLNGSLWETIESRDDPKGSTFRLRVRSLDDDANDRRELQATVHKHHFMEDGAEPMDMYERMEANEFDFGYALTVHKAQGSQFDDVVLMDECFSRDIRTKWLYTGITRAAKRIRIVRR